MKPKAVTIKFEHLRPQIQTHVNRLRQNRLFRSIAAGCMWSPTALMGPQAVKVLETHAPYSLLAAGSMVALGIPAAIYHPLYNKSVESSIQRVATSGFTRAGFVNPQHAEKYPSVSTIEGLRQYGAIRVDRRGNVTLVPISLVEKALKSARSTALKGIIPANYRGYKPWRALDLNEPNKRPDRLDAIWRRAEIHEAAMSAFEEEAAKPEPDFFSLPDLILQYKAGDLPPRHQKAIRRELENLAKVAEVAHLARRHFSDSPAKLYYALYGSKGTGAVNFPKTIHVFSIPFELSEKDYFKHPVAKESAGRAAPISPKGRLVRGGISKTRVRAIRSLERKLGVTVPYLREIATIQRRPVALDTLRHEDRHIASAALDAHRRFENPLNRGTSVLDWPSLFSYRSVKRPRFEEAYTQWGYNATEVIDKSLRNYYKAIPEDDEASAARLAELERLQREHGLSDDFMRSMLRTDDLQQAIDAINYHYQKPEPQEKPASKKPAKG